MRIVLFTDANNATSTALVRALFRLADDRHDLVVCGVVTSRPAVYRSSVRSEARRWARRALVAAADPRTAWQLTRRQRMDLVATAAARGIPVLVPGSRGINDPEFVEELMTTLRPDAGLSCYCTSIWRAPLLQALPQAVNYHDGLLPAFRGVAATSFSIYLGAPQSGFTFHRMTAGIDEGPILAQGAVPVGARSFAQVDRAKSAAAVRALPDVVTAVVNRDPGRAQVGRASYFSRRDLVALRAVRDPGTVTGDDVARRIRAFGRVYLPFEGEAWPVTRIRPGRHGRFAFRDARGEGWTADRVRGLPIRMARPA
jgi:methionyl-tRNA formyltransferase